MMRYKSLLQLLLRDKMYLEQPHVHGLSCPAQLEMKKESLISSRDKLKDRATSLWNRLSCPDEEAGEFKQKPLSTLCDDIKRVWACTPEIMASKKENRKWLHWNLWPPNILIGNWFIIIINRVSFSKTTMMRFSFHWLSRSIYEYINISRAGLNKLTIWVFVWYQLSNYINWF